MNVTVDDQDPSVSYQPPGMWWSSTNSTPCSYCLTPMTSSSAFKNTWHHGLHIIPVTDGDDATSTTSSSSPTPSPSSKSDNGDDDDKDDGDDKDSDSDKGKGGKSRRMVYGLVASSIPRGEVAYLEDPSSATSPFSVQKFDADDPQFADLPVFVQLNFTGCYLFLPISTSNLLTSHS